MEKFLDPNSVEIFRPLLAWLHEGLHQISMLCAVVWWRVGANTTPNNKNTPNPFVPVFLSFPPPAPACLGNRNTETWDGENGLGKFGNLLGKEKGSKNLATWVGHQRSESLSGSDAAERLLHFSLTSARYANHGNAGQVRGWREERKEAWRSGFSKTTVVFRHPMMPV